MGLDNLIDDADESTESSSNKSSNIQQDNLFEYGIGTDTREEPRTYGSFGYSSMEKYEDTIKGELKTHGELFKYHLPIFPHIEKSASYEPRYRYRMENRRTAVTCIVKHTTSLKYIPRDIIMIDTGNVEKNDCIQELCNRFETAISPDTEVQLYFFSNVRHLVKMAMSDVLTDDLSTFKKDMILKAVYDEQYTQKFREKHNEEMNLENIDRIEPW